MSRYDISIGHDMLGNQMQQSQANWLVRVANGDLYYVFISKDFRAYYIKSTDDGLTWGNPVTVHDTIATNIVAVWYDRWSSGSGDTIHIAFCETNTDDIHYRSLDTSSDTLGTDTVVFAGASAVTANGDCMLSITKARGGNLYIAFDMDGGTEVGFYRSTDGGGTWGARTDLNEAANSDYYYLTPGFAADTQDIMAMYWDRSADELSRKVYDDSGNSWAETSIAASMADVNSITDGPQFSVAVDLANSRILLAAWSARNTLNADLRFWTITEAAITEGTNVVLNSPNNQAMCSIALETDTGDICVFYGGQSDGSDVLGSAINIWYRASTDNGTTWGTETQVNTVPAANFTFLTCTPNFTGGNFGVLYTRTFTTTEDIPLVSAVLPSSGGSGGGGYMRLGL